MSRRGAGPKKRGAGPAASPPTPRDETAAEPAADSSLGAGDWALYQPPRHPRGLALVLTLELAWVGFLLWMLA